MLTRRSALGEFFIIFPNGVCESKEDQRNILFNEKPFSYKLLKDNKAQISYKGKVISTVIGKEYNKLVRVIQLDNVYKLQLVLAKITEQFKHGNEKDIK